MDNFKHNFLEKVKNNIDNHGCHITMVIDGVQPRYAYTIGTSRIFEAELIFAGGLFYMENEIFQIINEIVEIIKTSGFNNEYYQSSLGRFKISKVHNSWSRLMMLGVYDFYGKKEISALQIIPSGENNTLDIPDMSKKWSIDSQPIWKWLSKEWDYPVPKDSKIITNLDALKGAPITEVMRWEVDEWEAFAGAGTEVNKDEIRIISVGTLIGIDKSIEPILKLNTGKGIWRDSEELLWNNWN